VDNATDAFSLLSSIAEMGSNELFLNSQYVHGIREMFSVLLTPGNMIPQIFLHY
jgi:hypothetical protein